MAYTEAEWMKIVGPKATFLSESQAREILGQWPRRRVYGLHNDEIVALRTGADIDRLPCERIWVSDATIGDFVRKA